ncbi:hypothetical protein KP509_16G027400 [Ceratopteris richardii]|uniref:3-dehydrosphinganine reductase n=1 Tax=Ceratopteris richardii TaxID=49495 RepID=A0A8T2SZJ3_CERRI|nr:hypothetical protein KP509_16G027400 [Ceratopteris richardii]
MQTSVIVVLSVLGALPCILYLALRMISSPRPVRIPFANRHVLITGGSSGIGFELAKLALLEGASVSILARDIARLNEAKVALANSTGKEVRVFSADVKNLKSLSNVATEAGPIDVLICSHGVAIPKTFEDSSLDEINHMLDTNLRGNLYVIKAMLPSLKNRKDNYPASIAIVSSQAGQVGIYGYAAYSASKFGLKGLAESLQQELHCYNVRMSLIFPPDTYTPGFDKENETKPELTKLIGGINKISSAEDVAKKAVDGIKQGKFCIACNFDGWMLGIATMGMSPQPSAINAFAEIFLVGFLRLYALFITWSWYNTLIKWERKKEKHE